MRPVSARMIATTELDIADITAAIIAAETPVDCISHPHSERLKSAYLMLLCHFPLWASDTTQKRSRKEKAMQPRFIRVKASVYENLRVLVGIECLEDLKKAYGADILVVDDFTAAPLFRI
jgi:hypothetical protein